MYFESQTQFGDIPWPRKGSAGVFLDSAQSVADRIRVANKDLSRPDTDASLSCHTRNVSKSISRSSSGRSPKPTNTAPTVLIITSGALTAAVARMSRRTQRPTMWKRSGPATSLLRHAGLWRIAQILEGCTDAHPRRCHPRHEGNNPVEFSVGCDVHDPDLQVRQQPPRRIDVKAAQFRLDLGQRLNTRGENVGGDEHKRTIDRQPKLAGDLPQAPIVESSSLKQRVNQIRTSWRLSQELPFLLVRYPATRAVEISSAQWLTWASVSAGLGPGRSEPAARPHRRPST